MSVILMDISIGKQDKCSRYKVYQIDPNIWFGLLKFRKDAPGIGISCNVNISRAIEYLRRTVEEHQLQCYKHVY